MSDIIKLVGSDLAGPKMRRSYDPTRGWSSTWEYEGTHAAILGVVSRLGSNLYFEFDLTTPKGTLTIRTPDAGDPNDDGQDQILNTTFELQANTSQKSGYEHYRALALGRATIKNIKNAVSNTTTAANPTFIGDADTLYAHMVNSQDSFISPQFVFKLSQIVSRKAVVTIGYTNTSRIYTSAQLKAETNPTSLFLTAIDEAVSTVQTDQYGGSVPAGYFLGWLKQAPTITTIAGEKQSISVEHWLEAWSTFYYANA